MSQLGPGTTGKRTLPFDADLGIISDSCTWFVNAMIVSNDLTGHDKATRLVVVSDQLARNQQLNDGNLFHAGLGSYGEKC